MPERQAGQEAEAEGDHQGEVGVVGDRQDHGGDRHGDQLGVPGLHRQQADQADGDDDQAAEGGDPPQVAGDLGLVPVDVIADQREEGGDQHDDRTAALEPGTQGQGLGGGFVLHPEQDELLLVDLLVLLDQDVALAVGVVDVLRRCSGPALASAVVVCSS